MPLKKSPDTVTALLKWHKAVIGIFGTDHLQSLEHIAKLAREPKETRFPAGMVSRLTPEEKAAVKLALIYARDNGSKTTALDKAEFLKRIHDAEIAIKRVS